MSKLINTTLDSFSNLSDLGPELTITHYQNRKYLINGVKCKPNGRGGHVPNYVNLCQLEQLVKKGRTFKISTYAPKSDITKKVLARILQRKYGENLLKLSEDELFERLRGLV